MPERKTVIGLAIAAAFGGSAAALHYNKTFERTAQAARGKLLTYIAEQINYDEMVKKPDELASFCQRIPGNWRVSTVIADIITKPVGYWREVYIIKPSLSGSGQSHYQEIKPADPEHLNGLYAYREYTEGPSRTSRYFRDVVSMGKVTNWLVGKDYLPGDMRRQLTEGNTGLAAKD